MGKSPLRSRNGEGLAGLWIQSGKIKKIQRFSIIAVKAWGVERQKIIHRRKGNKCISRAPGLYNEKKKKRPKISRVKDK